MHFNFSGIFNFKLIFVIAMFSSYIHCKPQIKLNENSLDGDWFLSENTIVESFDYQEVFVKRGNLHIFTSSNYAVSFIKPFHLNKEYFYLLDEAKKDTITRFKVDLKEDEFVLINERGKIVYQKIISDTLLSDYIDGNLPKETFDKAFSKRLKKSIK